MRRNVAFYMGTLFAIAAAQAFASASSSEVLDSWLFKKAPDAKVDWSQPSIDFRQWRKVDVPHDWAIAGPFDAEGHADTGKLPWRGQGWYRKTIILPADVAGKKVFLDFDGIMARPEVFVNGKKAGGWDYGYMGFRVDASPFVKAGENLVAVKVDTQFHHSRWYPGAGMYRKAVLRISDPVYIPWRTTFITTPEIGEKEATVRIESGIRNDLSFAQNAGVLVRVKDPDGKTVAEKKIDLSVAPNSLAEFATEFAIANPRRWDVEDPALYTLELSIANGDTETTKFGIRTIAYPENDGFHLNGRRVQIQGVCLHSDLGPLGMAFDKSAMKRELEIMKDMGVNAIRTSHNCPAPELLELCDEMGLVVWDEAFDKWDHTAGRKGEENLEEFVSRNLREFVKRDRNHPCVIVWSISNEIRLASDKNPAGMTRKRNAYFAQVVRELDSTRPVGSGNYELGDLDVFADFSAAGFNYRAIYRPLHNRYPKIANFYTESASALSSYGYFDVPLPTNRLDYALKDWEVSGYDYNAAAWSDIPDIEFARMEKDRYCCGDFVWTGFDYLGEPTPYLAYYLKDSAKIGTFDNSQMARSSYFGIVDLTGVPKDRYWLYRSVWNKKSETVHLLPHWNWEGKEGQSIPVFCYTSGDEAELFLNGRSLGRKAKNPALPEEDLGEKQSGDVNIYEKCMNHYRLRWLDVPYEPGEIKVVAYKAGKKIGETSRKTAGKPFALKLTVEKPGLGSDRTAFVHVEVVDKDGTVCPKAKNIVEFFPTNCKLAAVGNGDARGLDSFGETGAHPLYFGHAVAYVRRVPGLSGEAKLTVVSEGLEPATIALGEGK